MDGDESSVGISIHMEKLELMKGRVMKRMGGRGGLKACSAEINISIHMEKANEWRGDEREWEGEEG